MKTLTTILLTSVILTAFAAQADDNQVPAIPGAAPLSQHLSAVDNPAPAKPVDNSSSVDLNALTPEYANKGDSRLTKLKIENDTLQQRARIAEAIGNSTEKPTVGRFVGVDAVYPYEDGKMSRIYCTSMQISDIRLQPGETIIGTPMAGDTQRWTLAVAKSGTGTEETQHVILKPLQDGLQTSIIITTNKHVYKIWAESVTNWYQPGLRWDYPAEEALKLSAEAAAEKRTEMNVEPIACNPEEMDFNYKVSGDDVDWKPVRVWNCKSKTYLKMPDSMFTSEAPAFFVIDEDGNTMLVNYRVKKDLFVIDRLFDKGVLKVGTKQEVNITHISTKTSSWWNFTSNNHYPSSKAGVVK